MYFLLTFLFKFFSKKSTLSVHQIVQFQSQKCKSSLVWEGGTPLPPRLRFLSNIVDNLAPPGKNSCVRPWLRDYLFHMMRKTMKKTAMRVILKISSVMQKHLRIHFSESTLNICMTIYIHAPSAHYSRNHICTCI